MMFDFYNSNLLNSYSHRLDEQLKQMIKEQYSKKKLSISQDESESELSVIVEFNKEHKNYSKDSTVIHQLIAHHAGCGINHTFSHIPCCSMNVTSAALEEMLKTCSSVKKVYLNYKIKALLNVAVPSVSASRVVRNNTRLTGKGINIAILDTGIYPSYDLQGRIISFADFINNRTSPYDDNGHGTHCAGCAAGNGRASSGLYQAPAFEANLIGVKVLDREGGGTLETVMKGIEFCINYNTTYPSNKIHVMSLSLGALPQVYCQENQDPLVQSVETAWQNGIVVVCAAGNEGPDCRTISTPGISNLVITVGAADDKNTFGITDDVIANFSSRGPTVYGVVKPDILAPGVSIVSLRSPNSYLDSLYPSNRVGNVYFILSGTSMATPIVAGIAAQLLQYNPSYTPNQVKSLIKNSPVKWRYGDENVYGAGYINAERTIPS